VALGRKNYLFAEITKQLNEAACYTAYWVPRILSRKPNHSINKIKELLPHHWKRLA
jgi:hypothetical protein